jgi:hypothetical protein
MPVVIQQCEKDIAGKLPHIKEGEGIGSTDEGI